MLVSQVTKVLGTNCEVAILEPQSLVGRVLNGKFVVGPVIGIGGSSTVYLGRHRDLRCPIAIKVLNRAIADHQALSRYFSREAVVTARMVGPHAVHVFDRGVLAGGIPFTVMEHLHGQTLESLLDRVQRLPATLAVDIVLQTCAALIEAHVQGVAHCDIKPENLFITELADGRRLLKVIDFGTARGKHTPNYIWSSCVGTPGYMAPEQINEPSQVDHRADIWALGVLLFRMVSGRLPFDGASPEAKMLATVANKPKSLAKLVTGLPKSYYQIVARCLAKDPAHRFQSAGELSGLLRDLRRQLAARGRIPEPKRLRRSVGQPNGILSLTRTADALLQRTRKHLSFRKTKLLLAVCVVLACAGGTLGAQFAPHSISEQALAASATGRLSLR